MKGIALPDFPQLSITTWNTLKAPDVDVHRTLLFLPNRAQVSVSMMLRASSAPFANVQKAMPASPSSSRRSGISRG